MAATEIQWSDRVWNVTRGCRRVSPGCGGVAREGGCYAEKQANRFKGPGQPYEGLVELGRNGPKWTGLGRFVKEKLAEPLSWRKPVRVFVNSMSDLFFEEFTNEEIAAVFGVMAACPHVTFQVLTKRAKRMHEWFEWVSSTPDTELATVSACAHASGARVFFTPKPWPLPNVHLGVSVEDQQRANERVPDLLRVPAAVRFVSYEPALGPVDFRHIDLGSSMDINALVENTYLPKDAGSFILPPHPAIDWIIIGGESGPGARPFHVEWARDLLQRVRDANTRHAHVRCFVKQLGAHVRWNGMSSPGDNWPVSSEHWPPGTRSEDDGHGGFRVFLKDRAGGDMNEWPNDLKCREFPR